MIKFKNEDKRFGGQINSALCDSFQLLSLKYVGYKREDGARARAPPLKNPKEDYKTVLKNSKKSAFQIGDQVRLSIIKNHFDKGYFRKWTEELFVIEKIKLTDPITYTVKSLHDEKIKGMLNTHRETSRQNYCLPFKL